MKSAIYLTLFLFIFSACSTEKNELSVQEKEERLVELKTQHHEILAQIHELEKDLEGQEGGDVQKELKKVKVLTLEATTFEHYIEVQGNVVNEKNVKVFPEASGRVVQNNVSRGQSVRKGQVLMELDDQLILKSIAEVKTRLELAVTVFEKRKKLWEKNIDSEVEYLKAKSDKESLEKSLETLEYQLSNTKVKAPIAGEVDEFFLNEGEMASPQMPACRIINNKSVRVDTEVSEVYLPALKKSDLNITVHFPNLGIKEKKRITHIGNFIHPDNRTFKIETYFANPKGLLLPNSVAVVTIKDFVAKDAIAIPSYLIQQSVDGRFFVFKAKKIDAQTSTVQKVYVKTGISYKGKTLIQDGLVAGDMLISEGYNNVVPNEKIALL